VFLIIVCCCCCVASSHNNNILLHIFPNLPLKGLGGRVKIYFLASCQVRFASGVPGVWWIWSLVPLELLWRPTAAIPLCAGWLALSGAWPGPLRFWSSGELPFTGIPSQKLCWTSIVTKLFTSTWWPAEIDHQPEWLDILDGGSSSSGESHDSEPQRLRHRIQLGCESSHPEPAESTGSGDAMFDDDPLAYDEQDVQPSIASIASPEEFRETKRAGRRLLHQL